MKGGVPKAKWLTPLGVVLMRTISTWVTLTREYTCSYQGVRARWGAMAQVKIQLLCVRRQWRETLGQLTHRTLLHESQPLVEIRGLGLSS